MGNSSAGLRVFGSEPLLKKLFSFGMTPLALGAAFFLCISITFSAWAVFSEPLKPAATYLAYTSNISWSLSLNLIFPAIVGLTLAYYRAMERTFEVFLSLAPSDAAAATTRDRINTLNGRFSSPLIATSTAVVATAYSLLVVYLVLNQGFSGWMTSGTLFSFISAQGNGLSAVGLVGILLQAILIYWVLNIFWRGSLYSRGTKEFFGQPTSSITFDPNHPDRCCGLKPVGDTAIFLALILFLLGMYLSLKVFDKTIVQGEPLLSDISGLILLGGYVILAPLLFQASIAPAHGYMNRARRQFIAPTQAAYAQKLTQIGALKPEQDSVKAAQDLLALEQIITLLRRKITVWPFSFRYSPGISMLIPVLSISVSLLLASARNIVLLLRGLFLYGATF